MSPSSELPDTNVSVVKSSFPPACIQNANKPGGKATLKNYKTKTERVQWEDTESKLMRTLKFLSSHICPLTRFLYLNLQPAASWTAQWLTDLSWVVSGFLLLKAFAPSTRNGLQCLHLKLLLMKEHSQSKTAQQAYRQFGKRAFHNLGDLY